MRQLSNTNGTNSSASRLEQDLQSAGILRENIDWLVPYLDMTQPERPELLERAVRQDLKASGGSLGAGFSIYLLVNLLNRSDQDFNHRVIKAFFPVVGPYWLNAAITQVDHQLGFWFQVSKGELSLDELLGPGGKAAMAAGRWMSNGKVTGGILRELTAGEVEAALARLSGPEDPVWPVLQCIWLSCKKEQSGGLLKTLLGGGKADTAQAVQQVQEGIIALLPQAGLDPHSVEMPKLVQYIRQGKDLPLPVRVQRPGTQYMNAASVLGAVGGACFLALESAPALRPAFVVCAALAPGAVLARSLKLAGEARFRAATPWLVRDTPFSEILMYLQLNAPELSKDLARQYPKLYEQAVKNADLNEANALISVMRSVDPRWADRIRMSNRAFVQNKIIQNIAKDVPLADRIQMESFLQTGKGLDTLLQSYPVGAGKSWGYNGTAEAYARDYGTDLFLVRCLIGTSMVNVAYHISSMWREAVKGLPTDRRTADALLELAQEVGLPALDCLRLVEVADKGYYNDKEKEELLDQTARWLGAQPEETVKQASEKGPAYARCAAVKVRSARHDVDALIALAGDGSKQVRLLAANALAALGLEVGGQAAVTLLRSKKASQRETGLTVIDLLDQKAHLHGKFIQTYRPQVEEALAKEKSDKLSINLRRLLGVQEAGDGSAAGTPAGDPIANTLKGGKKRKVQWALDGTKQLASRTGEGVLTDEDRLAAMMVCTMEADLSAARTLANAGTISQVIQQSLEDKAQAATRSLATARALAEGLDARSLAAYAQMVYELWMDQGAPSKQKWVLVFASLFGGREMVDILKRQINQWPQEARGAIACDAVYALALSPEPEGLLTVDSISRKFKFKQVKTAAGVALNSAAKALNLSPEELADRIVPDLGLDERGQRVFDFGSRSFTVTLTPALELEVRAQDGKKLKTLPAPGKQDDPALAGEASETFKALKKQIKATVNTQALRLELALSTARTWTGTAWRGLFVKKPVMRQFAIGLVWGVYEDGKLSACFRYLEDGSFSTVDEEEYELADQAVVGLVHPVELSAEDLAAWQEQLEDYEIKQPIPQLTRPVARVESGHEADTALESFGGRVLSGLSLSGKLLGMGWYRGVVEDAGIFYSFYREDGPIEVRLNFSGTWAGGDDSKVEVWDIPFYKGPTPIPLGQVPPKLYSEIVYQVQKATAASVETRSDWKTRAGRGI